MEFSKKLEELQSLQTQITDTAVELEDLRSRLATQSDAEQRGSDLSSKIDLLQLDLEKVQEERNSLKEEVEHLGRVRDAAVNDLDAFRYQSTEALKREAKLQQDLNRLRSEREEGRDVVSAATLTLRSPVEMAFSRPTSANGVHDVERRRLGHSRRQSLADLKGEQPARDAAAMVNVLQAQLKSEEERVKSLQNKLHAEIARREAEVQRVQRRERMSSPLKLRV
jgi:chromosome segregation ATPase